MPSLERIIRSTPVSSRVVSSGKQGAPGRDGAANAFEFNQVTPSSLWNVNHNFGYRPDVHIYIGAVEVGADVTHISSNQLQISFNAPWAGRARMS